MSEAPSPTETVSTPPLAAGTHTGKLRRWYPWVALLFASVWFTQGYSTIRSPYINLSQYAHGQERLPFQARDMMRWPMLLASHSAFLQRITTGRSRLHSPEFLVMDIAAVISLLLAGWAAMKLYRLALPDAPLPALPFAVLIILCYFDFILGVPFSFPYDLPATAFLGWGTYFAVRQRFAWLLPIFLLGTWNRETTLFLIGVWVIVAASRSGVLRWRDVRPRDWAQALVMVVGWVVITTAQKHHYAGNPSEAGTRILSNLRYLANPQLWPNILSASAFLLPYVYLNRDRISFAPIRCSLLLLPFWVLLLLAVGQILEVRIYGDISVLVAVAASLIFVQTVRVRGAERARVGAAAAV